MPLEEGAPPQPRCTRINVFAPCQTSIVEGPEGLLWPLEDPVCVQRGGRNQGNVRERDRNAGEHPDCSSRQLLKYQIPNRATFWWFFCWKESGCSDPKAPGSLMEGLRAAPATPLCQSSLGITPVPSVQDPGLPEGATHGGEADQCHQGDPGGHQERGAAERLLRVTRWERAWLGMREIVFKVPSHPNLWCSTVGGRAGAAAKGAAGVVL